MRIGITLNDEKGLESTVSLHFGQCRYFLIVDIENNTIKSTEVVGNNAQHGGGGCRAVDELLKYNITHVISGGMGMGAQQKFAQAGIKVSGHVGRVKDAINGLFNDSLNGLDACREHNGCH
ncbi:MAG: NifB/NifX family molybdenum-iron cluster-binding protein [bacterium]